MVLVPTDNVVAFSIFVENSGCARVQWFIVGRGWEMHTGYSGNQRSPSSVLKALRDPAQSSAKLGFCLAQFETALARLDPFPSKIGLETA